MARGHGRILTSIWDDADFLALGEREQRLYLFLISQPNLNHAGLLPLTLRRWSRKSKGLTSAELEKRLQALETARFIVMDDETEELLIRSFVRNDGVWKQPKVMGAMVSGALEISSRQLRRALLTEVDRIPLNDLSDEPGARGPSIRQQVSEHIETLRKAFREPDPTPSGEGSTTPSGPPSGTPSDTPAEGGPKASTRGRAPTSRAHSPAPAPAPAPFPSPVEDGSAEAGEQTEPVVVEESDSVGATDAPAKQAASAAREITAEDKLEFGAFWSVHPKSRDMDKTRAAWVAAVLAGADPKKITAAALAYAHECRSVDFQFVKQSVGWLTSRRYEDKFETLAAKPGPSRPLPAWCGECADGNRAAEREGHLRQTYDHRGNAHPCPKCHPTKAVHAA